ncbi:hypothetical protein GCM10027259_11990 [Micromonospora palomenae]
MPEGGGGWCGGGYEPGSGCVDQGSTGGVDMHQLQARVRTRDVSESWTGRAAPSESDRAGQVASGRARAGAPDAIAVAGDAL